MRVEEGRWTFGQILSVLLLSSPLFKLLTILASSSDKSASAPPVTRPAAASADADACACQSHWAELVSRGSSQQGLSEESKANMVRLMHRQGYYEKASWLGPTVCVTCFAIVGVTVQVFFVNAIHFQNFRSAKLADNLAPVMRAVWLVLYCILPGIVFNILCGMKFDSWLWIGPRRRFKISLLYMLGIFVCHLHPQSSICLLSHSECGSKPGVSEKPESTSRYRYCLDVDVFLSLRRLDSRSSAEEPVEAMY